MKEKAPATNKYDISQVVWVIKNGKASSEQITGIVLKNGKIEYSTEIYSNSGYYSPSICFYQFEDECKVFTTKEELLKSL